MSGFQLTLDERASIWLVGAFVGGVDKSEDFRKEGIWQNGYTNKYLDKVRQMAPGDLIVIKAATTQKHNLPFDAGGKKVSKMVLKATGVITKNRHDGRTVEVDWHPQTPTRDWFFYTYQGTVWKLKRGVDGAERLRRFILHNTPQQYAAFLPKSRGVPQADAATVDAIRVLTRLPISADLLLLLQTALSDTTPPHAAYVTALGDRLTAAVQTLDRRSHYTPRQLNTLLLTQADGQTWQASSALREAIEHLPELKTHLEQSPGDLKTDEPLHLTPPVWLPQFVPGKDVATITRRPFDEQRKGMASIGSISRVFAILKESLDPIKDTDLIERMDDIGFSGTKENTRRANLGRVRFLGLVTVRSGQVHVTELGRYAAETGDIGPVIEGLLVRVYGISEALQGLAVNKTQTEVVDALRSSYPKWTSNFVPKTLLKWIRDTGLAEGTGDHLTLTDVGRFWVSRLSASPAPAPPPAPKPAPTFPNFASLLAVIHKQGFVFDDADVLALHAAWTFHEQKRFAILSGLSGTGKTQLLLQYARSVCACMELSIDDHCLVVPVAPDWHDPSGLIGHLNTLHSTPSFHREPALDLMLRAVENPGLPYFLVLDEMNLAPVERWFAPFLSRMETPTEALLLHGHKGEEIDGVPSDISWPGNLRLGGTVNMDETTHAFSDKVLDRAFTLEFWEVHTQKYFDSRPPAVGIEVEGRKVLAAFQGHLSPIRRHVGYRVLKESLDWLATAHRAGPAFEASALIDQVIFSKVLPRLRGTNSPKLLAALNALIQVCKTHRLARCEKKLLHMKQQADDLGIVGFWA